MLKEPFTPCPAMIRGKLCGGTIIMDNDGGDIIQHCESCGAEYDILGFEVDTKERLNSLFEVVL